jgi:hypothetical protein
VIVFFPAVFPDALQPGEFTSTGYATAIACPACGVCQSVLRFDLRWVCENPGCTETGWIERASAVAV